MPRLPADDRLIVALDVRNALAGLKLAETLGDTHIVINVAPRRNLPGDGPVLSSDILSGVKVEAMDVRGKDGKKKEGRDHEKHGNHEKDDKNEAFGEHLRRLIAGIQKRDDMISIKELVSSLNRSKGEKGGKGEHNSIPEIITKVMAIIHAGTRIPPRGMMRSILYLHPKMDKYTLNDFHKAEEIIEIGYRTAREDEDFQKKLEKLLKKM